MASRINFLVAAGILTAAALLLGGFYLVAMPLAAVAPDWAPYVLGAWVLVALALVVGILARLHARLLKACGTMRERVSGPMGLAGQAMLYCGHIVVAAGAYRLLMDGGEFLPAVAAIAGLIYAGGIAATLIDWRRRSA